MLELMVAMSITVILLGMVMYMTSMGMDTYRESRDQVRAARQAKEALDAISKDFEAMVYRNDGSGDMWLYAEVEPELVGDVTASTTLVGPANKKISNASRLIFFTSIADRYGGDVASGSGDVSAVSYRLVYRDQISGAAAGAVGDYPVFTLYRHIVDPDDAFANVLGLVDLSSSTEFTDAEEFTAENVLVENIYELTVTFLVQTATGIDRITIGQETSQKDDFTLAGNGLQVEGVDKVGQLVGVEISITVLSDKGLVLTQKSGMSRAEIMEEHAYHYSKTVNVPR